MTTWKRGRGKLGALAPLLGEWTAESDSPMGPVRVSRTMRAFGAGWIEARVHWDIADGAKTYDEVAMYGPGDGGRLVFHSYTSDGKSSRGAQVDAPDVHPDAVAFEAEMPAGTARMIFWPDEREGFRWAVESKNAKGWSRFTEHHYRPAR